MTTPNRNGTPPLNLAPRLNRPLSPWNPLDYFRLLYWVFFFPQALPWYVDHFINTREPQPESLKSLNLKHRLQFQSLLLLLSIASLTTFGLTLLPGMNIHWWVPVLGVALGIISGALVRAFLDVSFGVLFGITFGITFGVVGNIAGKVLQSAGIEEQVIVLGALMGTALGGAAGMALNVTGSAKGGVDDDVFKGITGGMFFLIMGGIIYLIILALPAFTTGATTPILTRNLKSIVFFSIGLGGTFCLFLPRLPEYLVFAVIASLRRYIFRISQGAQAGRMVFLPLPGVRYQLEQELNSNWHKGIDSANQILNYTSQYGPVVKAFTTTMGREEKTAPEGLLSRAAALADRIFDWQVLLYCSASLSAQHRKKAVEGLFFLLPKKLRQRLTGLLPEMKMDTPARAACSGFWYWRQQEPIEAVKAFEKLLKFRHGTELYYIAAAIEKWFEIEKDDDNYKDKLQGIVAWEAETRRLKSLPSPGLRPEIMEILRTLQIVSTDIDAAKKALSPLKRSDIAGNNIDTLNRLLDEEQNNIIFPEWSLIKKIVLTWRGLLETSGWLFPDDEWKKPVKNPYDGYSGRPVTGPTFRGRDDIIERLENIWNKANDFAAVILYGQRRIGKTSILRYMAQATESDLLLVYISMQRIGKINHTGQLLFRFSEAIHTALENAGIAAGPAPDASGYEDMGTGCSTFNRFMDKLSRYMTGKKRIVLAIDEYELIEEKIQKEQIDTEFLAYLRSLIQEYSWFGLIFAGLHTLEEMGKNYGWEFFGQAEPIPVGYLKRDEVFDLIAYPKPPRIALEYSPELLDELYRLTSGQPYLVQRLCWELVEEWNERFHQEGEKASRTLLPGVLETIDISDFYIAAEYYFNGVWSSITDNERLLLPMMAERTEGPWTLDELTIITKAKGVGQFEEFSTLEETVRFLNQHDVITRTGKNIRFSSELMRRWMAEEKSG